MKYLALLAIPLLTIMPLANSANAQTSGNNRSNMITGSQIPDSLAWSSFFRHVGRALKAEATNPDNDQGNLAHDKLVGNRSRYSERGLYPVSGELLFSP